MLHVRSKQVSAIAEISVDFKYPISHEISSIIEIGRGDFFSKIQPFKKGFKSVFKVPEYI